MNIGIDVNLTRANAYKTTIDLVKKLRELNINIYMCDSFRLSFGSLDINFEPVDVWANKSDILISVGGDGTFIHLSHLAIELDKPILGINAGNLGFLTAIDKTELSSLEKIVKGDYSIDYRMILCCELTDKNDNFSKLYCLNDIVIARGDAIRICKTDVTVNGKKAISYSADGLILSTPTGSTAYSLSAGGPVLDPTIEGIISTPICNHTFFNRSVIYRPDSVIEIQVNNLDSCNAYISVDGEESIPLKDMKKILIRRGNRPAKIIKLKPDSFTDILKAKFSAKDID